MKSVDICQKWPNAQSLLDAVKNDASLLKTIENMEVDYRRMTPFEFKEKYETLAKIKIRRAQCGEIILELWELHGYSELYALERVWQELEEVEYVLMSCIIGLLMLDWIRSHTDPAAAEELEMIKELSSIFYGIQESAAKFAYEIRNMKDIQITEHVNQLVGRKIIAEVLCRRPLWTILSKYNKYDSSETTWTRHINPPKNMK